MDKSISKNTKNNPKELLKQIKSVVNKKIRPHLQADGGDITIIDLEKDGILKIKLEGACQGCPGAMMTLQYGVQQILDEKFPKEKIKVTPV